jgi:outer membrane protein TolC
MKKIPIYVLALLTTMPITAQQALSLKDCRQLAISHNKTVEMSKESVKAATELKKAAFAQFLPNFSANGTYTWNQKNLSLLSEDKYLPVYATKADGTLNFAGSVNNSWTAVNGNYVPLDASGTPFDPTKNPEKILWKNYALLPKDAMEFDIQNVFAGTIGFTQPIFMGGKIVELYKTAQYAEKLAQANQQSKSTELIMEVDEAYWRIISLENKVKLAKDYRDLLSKMDNNVAIMIEEGIATKADGLKVKVKLNEAEVMLTKAENGLRLSVMALNQLCGISLESDTKLADLNIETKDDAPALIPLNQALENRPEIKALAQMHNISKSQEKIMVSRFLPTVALSGGYLVSNPNVYNGYENEFGGMFSVSVVAHVPIFHFGDKIHTLNAAKIQSKISAMQLDEAKEKIQLQIQQNTYKVAESMKKRSATLKNIEQAQENLKCATDGFEEGVITSTDLLGAQTAWLSAKSEDIDAAIDVKLNITYLQNSTGTLEIPESTNKTTKK